MLDLQSNEIGSHSDDTETGHENARPHVLVNRAFDALDVGAPSVEDENWTIDIRREYETTVVFRREDGTAQSGTEQCDAERHLIPDFRVSQPNNLAVQKSPLS